LKVRFIRFSNSFEQTFEMQDTIFKTCFIAATTLTGILCGTSLDQSIKQLPARRTIGMKAFSNYAKAADLKNGVIWYAVTGIGAAAASIITAIIVWKNHSAESYSIPIYLGGVFAICHTICTTQAAPLYFSQKKITDEGELKKLFDKFERIQTIRSAFILLNLLAFVYALTILI
jgi:hypothetical protein